MIYINNGNNNITIDNDHYTGLTSAYTFTITNDIVQQPTVFDLVPTKECERYIKFDLNVVDDIRNQNLTGGTVYIENGMNTINITNSGLTIYNDILFKEFDEKNDYKYVPENNKFVYKKI